MNATEIAKALGGKKYGAGWLCRCPAHDDAKPSLSLKDSPTTKRILVKCFGGCEGGAVMAVLQQKGLLKGGRPGDPYEAPEPDPRMQEEERRRREALLKAARRIWHEAKPAEGTIVETYLRARAYAGAIPPTLRYHAALKHPSGPNLLLPGMVGVVLTEGSPLIAAIHRTFLKPDGSWKTDVTPDKAMLGEAKGGSVRLGMPYAARIAVAEGIETGLSAHAMTGLPVWAAMTAGGIESLILPPLPFAREVLIAADNDPPSKQHPQGHGIEAANRAAEKWRAEGRTVRVKMPPEVGQDFNDVLRSRTRPGMGT